MDLYSEIMTLIGPKKPFMLSELNFDCTTNEAIIKLNELIKKGKIINYGTMELLNEDIYYVPGFIDSLSLYTVLSPYDILIKYYLKEKGSVIGHIAGLSLENVLGLTTQVPNVITIVSNKAKIPLQEINILYQKVIVLHPRAEITKDNVDIMTILHLFDYEKTFTEKNINTIKKYIKERNLKKDDFDAYLKYFPEETKERWEKYGIYKKEKEVI